MITKEEQKIIDEIVEQSDYEFNELDEKLMIRYSRLQILCDYIWCLEKGIKEIELYNMTIQNLLEIESRLGINNSSRTRKYTKGLANVV